jgi:hypothetical protein
MASLTITEAELLDALAQSVSGTAPENAQTISEMMAATGLGEKRMRRALAALKATGRLQAHSVPRESLDGRPIRVPAFTILPAA